MMDKTCLAEGLVIPDAPTTEGNKNTIVAGTTGCGKSVSVIYSKLLHTYEASMIVPIAKADVMKKFSVLMKKRGYRVEVMDFINPGNSTVCYEPLDYLRSEEDIKNFAANLVGTAGTRNIEAYWYEAAVNVISVEILLIIKNAEYAGKRAKFTDVIRLHQSLRLYGGELAYTTLDVFVKLAQQMYPETNIRQLYSVLSGIAPKTASCILSIVNNAYSSTFTESVLKNIKQSKTINIEEIGQKKTVLFVLSSAMNKAAHRFINLFYAQVFKSLFEYAEKLETGRMPHSVHVLCDDFCCGCVIKDMDSYISIMRSTGIDVFLLIQSEAQLRALYGDYAAQTILDNCDTYIYMGGNDIATARSVAERINKSVSTVLSLPLEQVIVMRRGHKPVMAHRYRTFEDTVYIENFTEGEEVTDNDLDTNDF
ncbi:type IV secretory system conjugative DNA transfer family protein [Roseburia inulinivorans]